MEFVILLAAITLVVVFIVAKNKKEEEPQKPTTFVSVNPKDIDEEAIKKKPKVS